jgi:hypothetical protein
MKKIVSRATGIVSLAAARWNASTQSVLMRFRTAENRNGRPGRVAISSVTESVRAATPET